MVLFSLTVLDDFRPDGTVDYLTKGDNNNLDDRQLYNPGQEWLNRHHVIGKAKGSVFFPPTFGSSNKQTLDRCCLELFRFLPYVGIVTIMMNDYPYMKFILIGVLGLFVIANREN